MSVQAHLHKGMIIITVWAVIETSGPAAGNSAVFGVTIKAEEQLCMASLATLIWLETLLR